MQSHQIRKYDPMPYHKRKYHPADKMDMLLSKKQYPPVCNKFRFKYPPVCNKFRFKYPPV